MSRVNFFFLTVTRAAIVSFSDSAVQYSQAWAVYLSSGARVLKDGRVLIAFFFVFYRSNRWLGVLYFLELASYDGR